MEVSQPQQDAPANNQAVGQVTFWQKVVDPNTNHTYYWNTTTNEVSWTLPDYAVIVNEDQSSTEAGEESSDSAYADYYAYYAKAYYNAAESDIKAQPSSKQEASSDQSSASTKEVKDLGKDTSDSVKVSDSTGSGHELDSKKSDEEPMLDQNADGFVGPILPAVATFISGKSGMKRKATSKEDEETEGSVEPEMKKARVVATVGGSEDKVSSKKKQVQSSPGPAMSKQAEQAMRVCM